MISSDDLTTKPCSCGEQRTQVIGYDEVKGKMVPARRGWYCVKCREWEKAILRETKIERNQ